jgi:hypothetical protein
MLEAGRSRVPIPMKLMKFFDVPNPSSRALALGFILPLTELRSRNLLGEVKRCRYIRLATSPPCEMIV